MEENAYDEQSTHPDTLENKDPALVSYLYENGMNSLIITHVI